MTKTVNRNNCYQIRSMNKKNPAEVSGVFSSAWAESVGDEMAARQPELSHNKNALSFLTGHFLFKVGSNE